MIWLGLTIYLLRACYHLTLRLSDVNFLYQREVDKKTVAEEENAVHKEAITIISKDLIKNGRERLESTE